ncbi:geranylgeranyl reductase family [Methanolobus vulcani]|jgi:geranylgeranyl reductase family protein|uniref:Geranylgeranyl reductase family n=1 Tax=Methanolobus vulcani TaxID=38026 RepID=A0A7Z7AWZ9_9EURY|nr:geranylgeranyl reductase family protein [Methanolobus vulcani]MDK2825449.1 hypothetical protein [Methanolobus sp.]MDK2947030.1 hypothetical protein [Methanolobus sp.]SDF28730.1 geranylgeranyl reductase family [Methanolobus vulcani]
MDAKTYDLIIIGAGPSGSSAGRIAGQKGLKTLILEKEIFPRYKPCGGAISGHTISYLDFDISAELIKKSVFKGKLRYRDQVVEFHKDDIINFLVTRSTFDNFLLEKAKETGIDVNLGEKATGILPEKDSVTVTTDKNTYKCKFVVIATGALCTLKNHVREPDSREEYGVCLVTEIDCKNIDRPNDVIEIDFSPEGMGYGWIFPHDDNFSIGFGSAMAKYSPHPKQTMKKFLADNGFNGEYKLRGHILPCGGHKRKLVKGRVLLSGDSAGFVDALTGEGLPYAIRSGQIAAEIVAMNIGNKGKLKEYENKCYAEFGEHLKYSLYLAKLMQSQPEKVFNALNSSNELFEMYLEVAAFNKTYKDLAKKFITEFLLPGSKANT